MSKSKIFQVVAKIFVCIFALCSVLIITFFWKENIYTPYISFTRPIGGDFYNALTFATFFSKYITFPHLGWMHWWNEGTSFIEGYPFLSFYALYPLFSHFDVTTSLQLFSVFSLLLFYIFSFLLLWKVSRNVLVGLLLTIVLLYSKVTFFSLFAGGFIAASNTQWFLPLALLLGYYFYTTKKIIYLVICSVVCGISVLFHQPTAFLLIIPSSLILIFLTYKKLSEKIQASLLFLVICICIGAPSFYYFFAQIFAGLGTDKCLSSICWGEYPKHLEGFNPLLVICMLILLSIILLLKFVTKKIALFSIIPFFIILLIPILFSLASYFHGIDGIANSFFPRRTFWAAYLFLALLSSALFAEMQKILKHHSQIIVVFLSLISFGTYIINPYFFAKQVGGEYPTAYPTDAEKIAIEKYRKVDLKSITPSWFPQNEQNYRFHSFNQDLIIWWNIVFAMPATLGFANNPTFSHRDWLYFLQTSLSEKPTAANAKLVKNRAQFLLDAYAIGYAENSSSTRINDSIVEDKEIVPIREKTGWYFMKFSPDVVSPIVSPTNKDTILFIGDDIGYSMFIRFLAMKNISSQKLIPIKGPQNFDQISEQEFAFHKGIFMYRYTGSNWNKLKKYIEQGGTIFVENALSKPSGNMLPEIFPVTSTSETKSQESDWKIKNSEELSKKFSVDTSQFSPLIYQNGPWGMLASANESIKEGAETILTQDNKIIMAQNNIGKGRIIWSGWNMLYHVVSKENLTEANLMMSLLPKVEQKEKQVQFTVKFVNPGKIVITDENATGIYFKENYHPGWKAFVNGRNESVLKAGLDFMYVKVPSSTTSHEVIFEFTGGLVNILLCSITISGIFISLLYIVFPKPFLYVYMYALERLSNAKKKMHSTWNKED